MRRHGYIDDENSMKQERKVYFGCLVGVSLLLLCGALAGGGYWGWRVYSMRNKQPPSSSPTQIDTMDQGWGLDNSDYVQEVEFEPGMLCN